MGMAQVRSFAAMGGAIEEQPTGAATLDALSLELPRGAYTTLRTYHGTMALHLGQHIDRLVESAALEGHQLSLEHRLVRTALAQALARCGFPEARVRLTLAYDPPGALFISLQGFSELPASAYTEGVRCATALPGLRRETPRAKSTGFIAAASEARTTRADVNEVLLLAEDGAILEGSSSNFYAVLDGALHTAEEGVLAGITRGMVLALAETLLPVVRRPVTVRDLPGLSEAFITSVSRGVLPVVAIDDQTVGSGVPGPVTRELGRRFRERIEMELEPIQPDSGDGGGR